MRLDLYLSTENEMTRSKAKDLIKRGRVSVDDNIIEKPSFDVTDKNIIKIIDEENIYVCLLYTSPSPRDRQKSRMPSSA